MHKEVHCLIDTIHTPPPVIARSLRRSKPDNKLVITLLLTALIAATIAISGCTDTQSGKQISETRLFLDTYCTITIHGTNDTTLLNEAFELLAEYEALLSITAQGSDVFRINHSGGEAVAVDSRTLEVIRAALEFGVLSGGMFDITIGRVSRLWDFSGTEATSPAPHIPTEPTLPTDLTAPQIPAEPTPPTEPHMPTPPTVPTETDLQSARITVDYRQISIAGNTVQLANPDTWIDLGAIAKGYIGDKLAEFLLNRGVSGALIDLGGDVIAVGDKADGTPWRIALRKPFGTSDEWLGIIEVSGAAIISSGIYQRQFEKNGVLYHHILDPNTGMPAKTDVISAAVITESAITGEGLSTIAILVGSERIKPLFDQTPDFIGAVLVLDTGEILEFGDVNFTPSPLPRLCEELATKQSR